MHYLCSMFKYNVQKYIEENHLIQPKDKVLVALSGGADSVALFRVLLSLGYSLECAHCNFHLRGEESDRDETFVRLLCDKYSIPLHVVHFDTEAYAKEKHLSIEMAARELRYDWFEKMRLEREAVSIAVAHHRDDSVETFLLNLIRGTGINGLKGIAAQNGTVIRPLLSESRENILNYLQVIGQDYVTDSTNLQDEYTRNKIRLNIIPLLKDLNPSIMESIQDTSQRLSEVASIYHQNREDIIQQVLVRISDELYRISIKDILEDIAPTSLVFEILWPLGFNSKQIKDIYRCLSSSQSGKRFLSKKWEVVRDREDLLIHRIRTEEISPKLVVTKIERTPCFIIPKDNYTAYLDADKIHLPLLLRKWQIGDKFIPFGMKGKKKVSDYMTDKKFNLIQKEEQWVVCHGEEIVWLVNERTDNRFRITDDAQRILKIEIRKDAQ